MVTNTANATKLSNRTLNSTDFLNSKAIRLMVLYWLVLINVGISYLFIHILARV